MVKINIKARIHYMLIAVMLAIEHADMKGWNNLWLECDSY